MKNPISSTDCSKTGKHVKKLRALSLLCAGLLVAGSLAAGETGPELLTPAERAWLAEHPEIVLGVGQESAPSVVKDANGRFGGFAFDHIDLLNRRSAVEAIPLDGTSARLTSRASPFSLTIRITERQSHDHVSRTHGGAARR
ncbi:MAG: hypothetical protein P9F75_03895 [Candidatus Contendobacter sp.]|nr:hypothetical protein [Candidatus Contendobacter sp.]